jgi:VWFA-related protein
MMSTITTPRARRPHVPWTGFIGGTAFLLGFALAAFAEDEPPPWATFFEPVQVPLVSIEVVVTDADGTPIPGLSRDDFEVFEDGEPMEISHFYAAPGVARQEGVDGEPSSVAEPVVPDQNLFLVLYLDDHHIDPELRHATIKHLRDFLQQPFPPSVRAMLVRYDGSLQFKTGFTDRTDELLRAVDELPARAPQDSALEAEMLIREMQDTAISSIFRSSAAGAGGPSPGFSQALINLRQTERYLPQIHAIARTLHVRNRGSLAALTEFVDLLSGVPGRKGIVWFGSGLEARAGEHLFRAWEEMFPQQARRETFHAEIEARQYDSTAEIDQMVRLANARKVSFYTLSSQAVGASLKVSPQIISVSVTQDPEFLNLWTDAEALSLMSDPTGGRSFTGNAGLREQLDQIALELSSYYSLAYIPPSPGDGEYHRIKVKVRDQRAHLRYRQAYQDSTGTSQTGDRALAAAVLGVADNPLGIAIECRQEEARDDGRYLVPVLVSIPIGELVLLPEGPNHSATISLYTVVRGEDGRMSDVHGRQYPIEVPNDELLSAIEQSASLVLNLVMEGGAKRIAVSVRDDRSRIESTEYIDLEVGHTDGDEGG